MRAGAAAPALLLLLLLVVASAAVYEDSKPKGEHMPAGVCERR
jgi:hypothetical protein